MRKLLLSFAVLGIAAAAPVHAAPAMHPALAAVATLDQASVQTVQYGYERREFRRRQEMRRRAEIRRRRAARRGYYRPY